MSQNSNNPTRNELRKFGILFSTAIMLAPALFCLLFSRHYPWIKLSPISAALILWSLMAPQHLIIIHKPWMKFAMAAGWVNTRIILGVFYFLCFTPIAWLVRKTNAPLSLKLEADISYFEPVLRKKSDMRKGY